MSSFSSRRSSGRRCCIAIALAIEELYADRMDEQSEMLAYHFSKAEEWAKALDYLLKPAEKAAKAFANREAITLYDQALEAAAHLGTAADVKTLITIHRAKSNLYFLLSDFEHSLVERERLLTLVRQVGDRVSEGVTLADMALAAKWAHHLEPALAYAHQAVEVAEEADAKPVLAAGHFATGYV